MKKINLNGTWSIDYLSNQPYNSEKEPYFSISENKNDTLPPSKVSVTRNDTSSFARLNRLHGLAYMTVMITALSKSIAAYCQKPIFTSAAKQAAAAPKSEEIIKRSILLPTFAILPAKYNANKSVVKLIIKYMSMYNIFIAASNAYILSQ